MKFVWNEHISLIGTVSLIIYPSSGITTHSTWYWRPSRIHWIYSLLLAYLTIFYNIKNNFTTTWVLVNKHSFKVLCHKKQAKNYVICKFSIFFWAPNNITTYRLISFSIYLPTLQFLHKSNLPHLSPRHILNAYSSQIMANVYAIHKRLNHILHVKLNSSAVRCNSLTNYNLICH